MAQSLVPQKPPSVDMGPMRSPRPPGGSHKENPGQEAFTGKIRRPSHAVELKRPPRLGYETFGRLEPPGRWVRDLWPSGAAGGARVRDFWPSGAAGGARVRDFWPRGAAGGIRKPKTALGYETFGRQQPPGRHQRPPGAPKSRTLGQEMANNGTRVRRA